MTPPLVRRAAALLPLAVLALLTTGCSLESCPADAFACGSEGRWRLVTIEGIDPARPPDPRTDLSGHFDIDDGQGGYADFPLGSFLDVPDEPPEEQRARGVVSGRYSSRDHEGDGGIWELVFGLSGPSEPISVRGEVEAPFDGETFRFRIFDSDFRGYPLLQNGQTLVFRRTGG